MKTLLNGLVLSVVMALCFCANADTQQLTLKDGETLSGEYDDATVTIEAGSTVTFNGVTLTNTSVSAPAVKCLGDATIILADGSVNSVDNSALTYYAGIFPASDATLTIAGTGSLTVKGGAQGAGIGSDGYNYDGFAGNIVIAGGTVTAIGGEWSAGIGSGYYGTCGDITISGGTVTANGGEWSAGIGTGYYGTCGNITITESITSLTATKGTDAQQHIGQGDGNATVGKISRMLRLAKEYSNEGKTVTLTPGSNFDYYTVTWKNDDDTTIDTTNVEYGLMPEHADATKASDADFDYLFGWSPAIAEIESNTTYKAVFIAVPRVHSTGGNAEWSVDAEEGALRSGAIDDWGNTWFRTSVPRPCVFTFKWKASSEDNNDKLGFTINGADAYDTEGNKIEPISGVKDNWATVSVVVSNSLDVLEWKYWKDYSSKDGQDCGWIRNFTMAPFEGEVRTLSVVPNHDGAATVNAYAAKDCVMGVFPTVARYGYKFLGLFTAAEGGELVEPPYPLSADTTLYAHWAKTSDFETTGGDGDWIIEEDGITWRSGAICDIQKTWATYTVKRPCTVTFKWKISSEYGNDPLVLYVDGEERSRISGEMTDWEDVSLTFEDSANHVLKWEYSKDRSTAGTYDCGWIRDFVLTPLDSWVVTCDLNYDGAGEFGPRYVNKGRQLDVNEFPPLDEPREGYACYWAVAPWTGDALTNAVDISADTTVYARWIKQHGFDEFDTTCQEPWTWEQDGSIRTGKIGENTNTWARISVAGPCTVSFKWKTSSEGCDTLSLKVDGEAVDGVYAISGVMEDWAAVTLPTFEDSGNHIIEWAYGKDGSDIDGEDCGWIKDVVITAPESAPYTVTWKNADGTVLETDADLAAGAVPAYNSALPTQTADAQYYYDFAGWEPEFELVSSNTTYTAVYTATLRYYDVTWLDEDGTTLGKTNIVYGATPVYDGETPTKATTAQYIYDFAGWTPNVVSVTGDATYTATYTQTLRYYTVTWNDENGNKLGSDTLPYDETPSRNDPTKAATAQYTYTFAGWNPALATVTNDVTYTATYDATVNKYTITFKNYDGSTLQSGLVEYGTTPAYAGVTPTKAATAQFDYTFAGWTPSIVSVTESASYTATYTATSADGWKVLNLSEQTDAYTAQHRDMLTGTLSNNVKISIADGATVLLQDVTIEGVNDSAYPWAGITCEGDAWLVIEGTNVVKSFYGNYPGVFVPNGKTLTIRGAGKLDAYSQGEGAGIGGGYEIACGNIVINSGTIIAHAGFHAAGIGGGRYGSCGNITIKGGVVTASGGGYSAAIGGSAYGGCGNITINGGEVYAYGGGNYDAGIGSGAWASCGDITIGSNITKVVAQRDASDYIGSTYCGSHGTVTIPSEEILKRTYSSDGDTLTLEPDYKWNITWLSDEGELIEVTIVNGGAMPEYADQEKAADSPYRYIFTGWSPTLALAVSNATYTATFKKVVDLETATADYTAEDGDEIVGTTAHKVTIPGGATVTINGVSVTGAGGGAAVPAPAFAESGLSEVVKFAQAEDGKWTITAFAEMSNESRGTDVSEDQIKVYSGDTIAALEAETEPMSEGVTIEERKSAVKTIIKIAPGESVTGGKFFKVKFGE